MTKQTHPPSPATLRKLLHYDPETGALTWRKRTPDLFTDGKHSKERSCAAWNSRYAGKPALIAQHSEGYLHGAIFGRKYFAHRVAFAIYYSEWPNGHIDHINGDRADNRISNLRLATQSQNCAAGRMPSDNTSGFIGVCWDKYTEKWKAQINKDGKRIHIGFFDDPAVAAFARDVAAMMIHGPFACLNDPSLLGMFPFIDHPDRPVATCPCCGKSVSAHDVALCAAPVKPAEAAE